MIMMARQARLGFADFHVCSIMAEAGVVRTLCTMDLHAFVQQKPCHVEKHKSTIARLMHMQATAGGCADVK